MKKQPLSFSRALSILSVSALFLFVGSYTAKAGITQTDSTLQNAKFNYVGSNENLLMFAVEYPNPEGKNFVLEVRNDQREILYRHAYNSKNFSKKIYLVKSPDQGLVSFGIRSGKTESSQAFEIKPESYVVNDLVVKRL